MEANTSSMVDMPSPSLSSSTPTNSNSKSNTQQPQTPKTPEIPPSMLRLWRPQAQRNLRNQWSKLSSLTHKWHSSSSSTRTLATSLVNSSLNLRYMDSIDLGVLSDMPNIRKKACSKLLKQLELQRNQLLSSYKAMVVVVIDMTNLSKSMRCFLKTTSGSTLLQFSKTSEDSDDIGDGGGAPVVTFLPIAAYGTCFEVELLSNSCQEAEQFNRLAWADELYHGEADDLNLCNLYSKDTAEPFFPKIGGLKSETAFMGSQKDPNEEVFQVYLTTWLAEVNIDKFRVEEIFATVGEELGTSFS